jgi:hypothetical protein
MGKLTEALSPEIAFGPEYLSRTSWQFELGGAEAQSALARAWLQDEAQLTAGG